MQKETGKIGEEGKNSKKNKEVKQIIECVCARIER